ncbi:MAG TPA: UDP-N-acetylglucosamine 2-epimerase [Methylomirabilota bacterium]|jgi:UDP-hydrolysing UDP-N-acetyl-D-glucosamine 2-epimerase|nr:UDP-N-acetylglucosamine 2-epimerase [Methylomirabilota bacterium]
MSRLIGVVTVARSDYGHLTPVLHAIRDAADLRLQLFVAGAHLLPRFGMMVRAIEADGWPIAARIAGAVDDDTPEAIAAGAGAAVTGFARAFAVHRPDLLVVLGDRVEMLAAAVAALPFALPVAHVHGGEVTEGAMDEQARHAITKLAHLHFAAAEPYAARIRAMGEEGWRVHTTGAPGLDRLAALPPLSRETLASRLGLPLRRPTLLVTFHPETLAAGDVPQQVDELATALEKVEGDAVVTFPGADTASGAIITRLRALERTRPHTRLVESLGDDVYASLLREADVMVGNSSSGLIEAPAFALPVVNIGDRQRGRLRGDNVIDVGPARDAIVAAIARALDPAFRRALAGRPNPYGDGRAAPRIVRVLREVELGPRLVRKRFVDSGAGDR